MIGCIHSYGSYTIVHGREDYISGFRYCILNIWINSAYSVVVCCCCFLTEVEYTLATKAYLKYRCSQGRVGPMATGLLLVLTCNQDAVGARPSHYSAASLLPSCSRKLAIMKQWFEPAVERPSYQFCWQWQQWLVEYKLVLVLSLDPPPGEWNYCWHFSV